MEISPDVPYWNLKDERTWPCTGGRAGIGSDCDIVLQRKSCSGRPRGRKDSKGGGHSRDVGIGGSRDVGGHSGKQERGIFS